MAVFLAAIPAAISAAAASVGTAATTAATAIGATTAAAGTIGTAGLTVGAGGALGSALTVGGATVSTTSGILTQIGATLGALATPANALTAISTAAGVGGQIYSSQQQDQMLKMQSAAEQKQFAQQQMQYQSRVRQVMSMNIADAAARGVTPGGSLSAAQQSILDSGTIATGQLQSDMNSTMNLYGAARKNAMVRGYGGAATSLFGGLGALSGGRIV